MLSAAPRGAIADEPEYTPDSIDIYQDWRWLYTAWWTILWLGSCRSEELPKDVEHRALGSPTVEKESNWIIGSLLDGLQLHLGRSPRSFPESSQGNLAWTPTTANKAVEGQCQPWNGDELETSWGRRSSSYQ